MKKLILFTFIYLVCVNLNAQEKVEFKFEKGTSFPKFTEKNPGLNYLKLNNATAKEKSILIFIGFNKSDSVKVSSSSKIILDKNLYYSSQTGISEIEAIENTEDLKMEFLKVHPIEINLDKKDMKKYKHIYISRKNGKYVVEYSNKLKSFM